MSKLGLFASASALLLLSACPSGPNPSDGETGTETQSATESGDGDGDGDGDTECMPPGMFGDCANGGLAACMAGSSAQCVQDDPNTPSIGVCGSACADVCDCWAPPADGTAPVACQSLAPGDDGTCVLDCSAGQTCPAGMSCNTEPAICVFTVN
jgi:hypothetical protein